MGPVTVGLTRATFQGRSGRRAVTWAFVAAGGGLG
jgi:hypothetical protein